MRGALGGKLTFDYIIVGGGTAWNVMGVWLTQAGFHVAIVEAGTFNELAKPILGSMPGCELFGVGTSINDSFPETDWEI